MSKGELTRAQILTEALSMASVVGLDGVSIGALADALHMSKSGLFAHFGSKESLQIQVLDHAASGFRATVVQRAFAEPRGEPRLRALLDLWLEWARSDTMPGGCVFVTAGIELDDSPGPVRDRLELLQADWFGALARTYQLGVEAGAFRADIDPDDVAQSLQGILLAYHHRSRLMRDPHAEARARRAFERLLDAIRATGERKPAA